MKANNISINTITITTKGKTGHGVEFTLVGVHKYADIPEPVRALLAEGEAFEGYKWHAPQTKSEDGYLWKGFATAKEAKAEAKRLKAFQHEPAKADAPVKAKATKGKGKKTEPSPKEKVNLADLKGLFAGLSPAEKAELVLALFA